jgi:hypothetical protein
MTRTKKILAFACAASALALSLAWAQPGGDRGGGSRGGGFLSADQLLGVAALHPDIALSDEQLLKLRAGLQESYAEQLQMREALRSGAVDFSEMREIASEMRKEMMAAVQEVLTEEQAEALRGVMASAGGRRGGGGGGGFR